jgi:hypothetical protein
LQPLNILIVLLLDLIEDGFQFGILCEGKLWDGKRSRRCRGGGNEVSTFRLVRENKR